MKIKDILSATNGTLNGSIDLEEKYNKIKIDSRKIEKNDIYIAIKGENHDGHSFIQNAIDSGAKLIISSKKLNINIPFILVNDTLKSLGDIAHYIIKKYNPTIIAITGSVGKTTTRNLLYHVLKEKYKVHTNEKNHNNDIGVPLTIFNLKKDDEILILEMGMNHFGEISYLSKMVNPNIAIITNIGSSHIGNLKTKDNILKAKLEIIDGMNKKILFINGDDEYLSKIKNIETIKSGFKNTNDLIAYDLKSNLYSSSFKIKYDSKEYEVKTSLPKHLQSNVLNVINVALYYNVDIEEIIKSLESYKTFDKRMDIIKDKNNNTIINDCYNSSFESLTGVLELLKNESQNKLLILGDIKELGIHSKKIHQSLKPYIEKIDNKKVILIGDDIKNLDVEAEYFKDYEQAIEYLETQEIKNTLILIKGSRAIKLENITNYFLNK